MQYTHGSFKEQEHKIITRLVKIKHYKADRSHGEHEETNNTEIFCRTRDMGGLVTNVETCGLNSEQCG